MLQAMAVFTDVASIICNLTLFIMLMPLEKETPFYKKTMYIGGVVIVCVYLGIRYVMKLPGNLLSPLFLTLPSLVLFYLLCRYKDGRFLLTFCAVDTICFIVGIFGFLPYYIFGTSGAYLASALLNLILFFLLFSCGKMFFAKYRKLLEVQDVGWQIMALSSALFYLLISILFPFIGENLSQPFFLLFSVVLSLTVITCYVVFFQSIVKTAHIYEQNARLTEENMLYQIAYTDGLTHLGNRAAFIKKINELQRKPPVEPIICTMIDMNGLKEINDTFGHHAGDKALKSAAKLLHNVFAKHAHCLYRIGGDEFVLFLYNETESWLLEQLLTLEKRQARESQKLGLYLSFAIGYEFLRQDGSDDVEKALRRADQKMYDDKREKKSDYS